MLAALTGIQDDPSKRRTTALFLANCDYPNNSEDYIHRIGRIYFFAETLIIKFGTNFLATYAEFTSCSHLGTYLKIIINYFAYLGRTGRKGNIGTSYTQFTPNNAPKARDLVSVLTEAKQVVNPTLQEVVGFRGRGGGGGRGMGGGRGGGNGRNVVKQCVLFRASYL